MWKAVTLMLVGAVGAAFAVHAVFAQGEPVPHNPMQGGSKPMDHVPCHRTHRCTTGSDAGTSPAMPGQDAFGALAEVVRLLDADPQTDWSKVDLERLRQHLIDMNEVVLRSEVKQTPMPGGLAMEITGTGRTERAIPPWSSLTRPSSTACRRGRRGPNRSRAASG